MGEENITKGCIRYQTNSVVVVFILCRVSETFDIETGQDSVTLRVAYRLKMITNKQMLNTDFFSEDLLGPSLRRREASSISVGGRAPKCV